MGSLPRSCRGLRRCAADATLLCCSYPDTHGSGQSAGCRATMGLARSARVLVDVGDAVEVEVLGLAGVHVAVVPVAQPQHPGGEHGGDEAAGEDGELDVVVSLGAATEGELADEQADGEAHSPEHREAEDV